MAMRILRSGTFPHQMYVAHCNCIDGREEKTRNHLGQCIAPPKCSTCKRPYRLDEKLAQSSKERE